MNTDPLRTHRARKTLDIIRNRFRATCAEPSVYVRAPLNLHNREQRDRPVTRPTSVPKSSRKRWSSTLYNTIALISEWNRWRRCKRWLQKQKMAISHTDWNSPPTNRTLPVAADARPTCVVFGLHWLDYGGAEKYAIRCIEIAREKYFCVVLTDRPSTHPLKSLAQHPNVTIIHLDQEIGWKNFPNFIHALFTDMDVKILHLHHCMALYDQLENIQKISPRTHVVDTLHIIEHNGGGYPQVAGTRTKYIDTHHVISDQLRQYLAENFNRTQNVAVAKLIRKDITPPIEPNILKRHRNQSLRITFIGRLDFQKRPRLFILIARHLTDKITKKHALTLDLKLIGEGPLASSVQKLNEANRDLGVQFLPAGTNVPQILSESDFLILPSENEGIPLVAYEALEQGCIPICTDVGANSELCGKLVVPPAPTQTITQTKNIIDRFIQDPYFIKSTWAEIRDRLMAEHTKQSGDEFAHSLYSGI